jgi:superfamily II DNA or RNA helicase
MTGPHRPLRAWQEQALAAWERRSGTDFLAVATPGSGKTTFALAAAHRAFTAGTIDQLVVVCPSDHLRTQWADAAASAGMPLDPEFSNAAGTTSPQFCGIAVTYAQVAAAPQVHTAGVAGAPTMVILDEVHHGGHDRSWGEAIRAAYAPARVRLALSGTPWRTDITPIPFVSYVPDADGAAHSIADFRYGYGPALADGVVRPVLFLTYSGRSHWRTSAGDELAAHLDDPLTPAAMRQAWRTALDPAGDWISTVLRAANERLDAVRAEEMPDAGGIVLASNQSHARAYATVLEQLSGQRPTVVLSDDSSASDRIDAFARDRSKWLVAVRMVSEGVDLPRAALLVYATNAATPLFFAQAVGRVVRARTGTERATVFVPSVAPLLALAADLETDRDHVLVTETGSTDETEPEDLLLAAASRDDPGGVGTGVFAALAATGHLDRVIYAGTDYRGGENSCAAPGPDRGGENSCAAPGPDRVGEAERRWLALPGLLEPADLAAALRRHPADRFPSNPHQSTSPRPFDPAGRVGPAAAPVPLHRQVTAARRELHQLVARIAHRTGAQHGEIHARLRASSGGPAAPAATLDQLETRVTLAHQWI